MKFICKQGQTHHTNWTLLRHWVRLEFLHNLVGMSDLFTPLLVSLAVRLLAGYIAVVDRSAGGAYLEVDADPTAGAARL